MLSSTSHFEAKQPLKSSARHNYLFFLGGRGGGVKGGRGGLKSITACNIERIHIGTTLVTT